MSLSGICYLPFFAMFCRYSVNVQLCLVFTGQNNLKVFELQNNFKPYFDIGSLHSFLVRTVGHHKISDDPKCSSR